MPSSTSSSSFPSGTVVPPKSTTTGGPVPAPPGTSSSSSKSSSSSNNKSSSRKLPDHRDPSGYVESPPSCVVKVHGTARDDINGLMGIVISYNLDRERYLVHMTKSQSTMAFRMENLSRVSWMENYRANWQQLRNDPRVRQKMTHYKTMCRAAVAPAKLSHVIVATILTVGLLLVTSGISKTIMAMSLLILLILISGNDILEKKPIKTVVRNFPNRARITIEQHMPLLHGKLSNRMAAGIMFFIVFLVVQSLCFPFNGYHSSSTQHHDESSSSDETEEHIIIPLEGEEIFTTTSSSSSVFAAPLDYDAVQKYYELGFQDGKDGIYGTSLPTQEEFVLSSSSATTPSSSSVSPSTLSSVLLKEMTTRTCTNETESDNYCITDDGGNMIGPEETDTEENSESSSSTTTENNNGEKSKDSTKDHHEKDQRSKAMSITNAASMFYLYKSFQELGTCPHTGLWGMAQLFANLHQAVPLWRKVLMGLSIYNVIRIIL